MLKTNIIFLMFFTCFAVSCNNVSNNISVIDNTKLIKENFNSGNITLDGYKELDNKKLIKSENDTNNMLIKEVIEKPDFSIQEDQDTYISNNIILSKKETHETIRTKNFEKEIVLSETIENLDTGEAQLKQKNLNTKGTEKSKAALAALELFSKPQYTKKNKIKSLENKKINLADNKSLEKIALLIPTSGQYAKIGESILKGVELAYFENQNKNFEIKVFDTNKSIKEAAHNAVNSSCGLIIGPVFSNEIKVVKEIVKSSEIPILSFSNDIRFNVDGVWLLGQLLKDEINLITDYVIDIGLKNIAILGTNNEYGQILTNIIKNNLENTGGIKKILLINQEQLEDLNQLRSQIKDFTGWKKLEDENSELPDPKFDAIIFSGNKSFIIKTAPLLSYYDHGPDRTFIFGNSQMAQQEILSEPSLSGAYFSSIKYNIKNEFINKWKQSWGGEPSILSALGYDIVKILNDRKPNVDLVNYLIKKDGHSGFTGKLWLSKNGLSNREVFLHKIENKKALELF